MGEREYEQLRYPRRVADQGQPHVATPGRITNTQSAAISSSAGGGGSNGIYAPPGNLWTGGGITGPGLYKTGSALADHGLGCDPVGDAPVHGPCFLHPKQRSHLLAGFQHNVGLAHTEYLDAVTELKVEELLRKEPEQSEWLFELFVDVITLVALSSVKTAIHKLTGATDELASLVTDQQRAINELSAVTESGMTAVLGGVAGKAREAAPNKAESAHSAKSSTLSYLALVKREASKRFHHLQQDTPASVNDAQLLVLFKAYDPDNGHRSGDYARELRARLDRFKKSGVAKLGVQQNNPFAIHPTGTGFDDQQPEAHWQIATAAFWVNTPIGRRLALYRRGHNDVPERVVPLGGGISRARADAEAERFEQEDLRARPFVFYKYVSSELIDIAIQMHVARWHAAPEEHALGPAEFQAMAWDR